jgi:Ca-activated chloride channel family protein
VLGDITTGSTGEGVQENEWVLSTNDGENKRNYLGTEFRAGATRPTLNNSQVLVDSNQSVLESSGTDNAAYRLSASQVANLGKAAANDPADAETGGRQQKGAAVVAGLAGGTVDVSGDLMFGFEDLNNATVLNRGDQDADKNGVSRIKIDDSQMMFELGFKVAGYDALNAEAFDLQGSEKALPEDVAKFTLSGVEVGTVNFNIDFNNEGVYEQKKGLIDTGAVVLGEPLTQEVAQNATDAESKNYDINFSKASLDGEFSTETQTRLATGEVLDHTGGGVDDLRQGLDPNVATWTRKNPIGYRIYSNYELPVLGVTENSPAAPAANPVPATPPVPALSAVAPGQILDTMGLRTEAEVEAAPEKAREVAAIEKTDADAEGKPARKMNSAALVKVEKKQIPESQIIGGKGFELVTGGDPHADDLYANKAFMELEDVEVVLPTASQYPVVPVNPFVMTAQDHLSTFAIDVDTASYTLSRRFIAKGYRPPVGAVRMEEFVNAFDYNYATQSDRAFTVHAEAAPSPFGENLTLVKIGVKAKVVGRDGRKPARLTLVVDASGSMDKADRLGLVKRSLKMLVDQLQANDSVSLITYGTHSRLMLQAAPASDKDRIKQAIDAIQPGGSTNMIEALNLGYEQARAGFRAGFVNRVMLCSDGVANVGETDAQAMLERVDDHRRQGITFTSVGFGMGAYNDSLLEKLANRGDGFYAYVDSETEARRLFVTELSATLQTVAKDAKIQVDFDPKRVRRYRLIGYENRDVADKDFRNDRIDAGEVGSGQSATALYEVELLAGAEGVAPRDLGAVYVRYRDVDTDKVEEISQRLSIDGARGADVADRPYFYLAACVGEFAEQLRASEHTNSKDMAKLQAAVIQLRQQLPLNNQVAELRQLIERVQGLPQAP